MDWRSFDEELELKLSEIEIRNKQHQQGLDFMDNDDVKYRKLEENEIVETPDQNLEVLMSSESLGHNLSCPETVGLIARRKDTKDSGYGDVMSEHDEEAVTIPDWCQECEATDENDNQEPGRKLDEKDNGNQQAIQDENCSSHGEKNTADIKFKAAKRQRRITPVPNTSPFRLDLTTKPDCLFVEEEDAEDISNFNSEDDFITQESFTSQMADSPKWKHKALATSISSFAEPDTSAKKSNDPDKQRCYTRSFSERHINKNKKTGDYYSSPETELLAPSSMPPWMQKADSKEDLDEPNCAKKQDEGDRGSDLSSVIQNCTVKMRNTGIASLSTDWFEKMAASKKVDITEEIVRIYVPAKEKQKGSRVRKLTPVRPSSPSLEKLSDLQKKKLFSAVREDAPHEVDFEQFKGEKF